MQTGPSDGRRYCSKWWEGSKRSRYTFGSIYALVGSAQSVRMRKNRFATHTTTTTGNEESNVTSPHRDPLPPGQRTEPMAVASEAPIQNSRTMRLPFRGSRSYLRALRAAELTAWNALILSPGHRQMILRELTLGSNG